MRDADFLFWENDWLYLKFCRIENVRGPRYVTLKAALNIFLQHEGKLIVETGTQRVIDDPGGCSTLLFGAFCKRYDKHLITVDNVARHMEISKQATQQYKNYITYAFEESVKFLTEFKGKIDLLYLDSLDCPFPPGDATQAQEHQLKELKAAYDKLHIGTILLLDDNDFENGGKTRLSKKFLLESGEWLLILDYAQSLWVKAF